MEFSFYSLIAACLERRVWLGENNRETFANLNIIFVGDPGTGKSICARVNANLLKSIKEPNPCPDALDFEDEKHFRPVINISPNATTLEGLMVRMEARAKLLPTSKYPRLTTNRGQAALYVHSEELENLFKNDANTLIGFLCECFDAGDYVSETKTAGISRIRRVCINILAATNPGWMGDAISKKLITSGLSSRTLFIWGGSARSRITFIDEDKEEQKVYDWLHKYCSGLVKIAGPCEFAVEASTYLNEWYTNKEAVSPITGELRKFITNTDKNLIAYYSRKKIITMKLAMVHNYMDTMDNHVISVKNVDDSICALERAEVNMHQVLACAGSNSTHALGIHILRYLKEFGETIQRELWVYFNDIASIQEVNVALDFLELTLQVRKSVFKGELAYQLCKITTIKL